MGWRARADGWATRNLGRPITHLTPRYVAVRTREAVRRRLSPGDPWLTADAIRQLSVLIRPTHRGLEFGAGRSTPWLARRAGSLTSVEHSPHWAAAVRSSLAEGGIENVSLVLVEDEAGEPGPDEYLAPARPIAPGTLDFVLVDGLHRDRCALAAIDLLASGGVLILDNAERYLGSDSKGPDACRETTEPLWLQFEEAVGAWRRVWTSNGVWDTALWFKP